MIEHRYEEQGDTYLLRSWTPGETERMSRGHKAHRAEWLREIIEVAAIGGHAYKIATPPPDLIVWFVTDDRYVLIEFPDELKADVMAYQHELNFTENTHV